jgi:hypothetical protein
MTPRLSSVVVAIVLQLAAPAAASQQYAIVITGASGAPEYVERFDRWRDTFVAVLLERYGYPRDHVIVLGEDPGPGVRPATAAEVHTAIEEIARQATALDMVLVLLMGHGSVFEGEDARFNLVGPDLTMTEWASALTPVAGRLVFVNLAAGSSPFLRKLAGRNRVVVTATNATAQRFTPVFPEFFIEAFEGVVADVDRNGRVSIGEAFEYASAGVRSWFRDLGQPATERALIDDTGAGAGREAGDPGTPDGLARSTYLEPDRVGELPRTGP